MHEMALCENILQVLEEQAVEQDFAAVKTVWLEIGPLAGVELEALRFSFEAVASGTLADRAKLVIIETRGEAWCASCAKAVPIQQRFDACPICGGYRLEVLGGEELRIKELEVV